MDRKDVGQALKEIADSNWKARNMPILLSSLSMPMRIKFPQTQELKKILGGSIKAFIKKSGQEFGYQLIEHPTQKAKIGLAPLGVNYDFENVNSEAKMSREISQVDGVALIGILKKMSIEDQRGFSIPGSVIVKMFG
ncbi:hypothetical protein [Janthinobacterium lividum]|uniref:hypothetical protein n=1 Tax=Janthinobacterium lividum TaxID=29581 RepID=UPI001114786B|nr:hypothetical protein [Janthinobacterium lividum]